MVSRDEALDGKDARHTRKVVDRALSDDSDTVKLPVRLTKLGAQILVSIQSRTGRTRHQVLDHLLRENAAG